VAAELVVSQATMVLKVQILYSQVSLQQVVDMVDEAEEQIHWLAVLVAPQAAAALVAQVSEQVEQ
jgi:hypothetical protein